MSGLCLRARSTARRPRLTAGRYSDRDARIRAMLPSTSAAKPKRPSGSLTANADSYVTIARSLSPIEWYTAATVFKMLPSSTWWSVVR